LDLTRLLRRRTLNHNVKCCARAIQRRA